MEPCANDQHRWAPGSWPVHYNGGNSTNHVRKCLDCDTYGVAIRYSNRKSTTCPLKPEAYEKPLGRAVREHERAVEERERLFG